MVLFFNNVLVFKGRVLHSLLEVMVLKFSLFALFLVCAHASLLINNPFYCYSKDPIRPQLELFGPTTEYVKIRDHHLNVEHVSKCKPARFWYQGRHGSRYPSAADGDNLFTATTTINNNVTRNYKSSKTTLCPSDAELIKNWQLNVNFTLPGSASLTETGRDELKNLAIRLRKYFPTLLPDRYSPDHYYFHHSPVSRTLQSAQAFAGGLFGPKESQNVDYLGGEATDRFTYPFGNCAAFVSIELGGIPQLTDFEQTSDYLQMVKDASQKLGFHGSQQLSANIVSKIITHCRYEQIYNHIKPSAFCSAFSYADQQVNEYISDLSYYYLFGYGNTENRVLYENMSCYLLQALLQFLQSNNPNDQKAKLWFAHDVNLTFMFVALGLYEDEIPLSGTNFAQQGNRKWKISYITPMAANLVVVRYE